MPRIAGEDPFEVEQAREAWSIAEHETNRLAMSAVEAGDRLALMVSPMLTCEMRSSWSNGRASSTPRRSLALSRAVQGRGQDLRWRLHGQFGKGPNARGVRRVLGAVAPGFLESDDFMAALGKGVGCIALTGGYPSTWVTEPMVEAVGDTPLIMMDLLPNRLTDRAAVLLPTASWTEKARHV